MRRLFAFIRRCLRRKSAHLVLYEVHTPLPRQVIVHKVYAWKPMVTSFTRKQEEEEHD